MHRPDDLAQNRFRLFLRAYAEERGRGWQTELGAKLGRHQTYIGRLEKGLRRPGIGDVQDAMRAFHIAPAFFFDASLGPTPDYRDFRAETRVEPAERVEILEQLFEERAALGRPVAPGVATRARTAARSTGVSTRGEASLLVEVLEMVEARERRESVGQAPAPATDARAVVATEKGQTVADPARFKRRSPR